MIILLRLCLQPTRCHAELQSSKKGSVYKIDALLLPAITINRDHKIRPTPIRLLWRGGMS